MSDNALWGECQGSGSKPYQVRIELGEPAYKCSCPSRKFPCKHSIGLLLMAVAGSVQPAEPAAWVSEWLGERSTRAEKKKEKAEASPKPVDVVAQAKRKENRLEKIDAGLAALSLWTIDLIRTGIATVPSKDYNFFDEQARRLIDAQAPGVARRVQQLAGIASSGLGWQRVLLEKLAQLHLIVKGFSNRQNLSETTRELLLDIVGLPRAQEDVLATTAIPDCWQVLASETTSEGNLRVRRSWLLGLRSQRSTCVFAFAHANMPLDSSLVPGYAFDGEVCLYPGESARGLVKTRGELTQIMHLSPSLGFDAVAERYAEDRAGNPWTEGVVVPVSNVAVAFEAGEFRLIDSGSRGLKLTTDDSAGWTLLALSGGEPIDVVVFHDGHRNRPLGAIVAGSYASFAAVEQEAIA